MALDKFKAAPLPNPPADYDPQYLRQVIRVLETYFSQLDSRTPNNAQKYTADEFVGGSFTGTNVTATNTSVITLDAVAADIDTQVSDRIFTDYLNTYAHRNGSQISQQFMAGNVYADFLYGDGRYVSTS